MLNVTANAAATILYLEDDPGSQRLVQRVLENHGYEVLVADNGTRGIALAQESHPGLILMDINLPGMDGKEITTRLRSLPHFADTPIVALTANVGPGNREQALAAGCTGFLTKPINVSHFPDQVKGYLNGRVEKLSTEAHTEELERYAQRLVSRLEAKIEELETVNQQLRELDQMKSDFIALVSHELRTPLTLVSGYTYLLADKAKRAQDQHQQEWLPVVTGLNRGIDRLTSVVNEIISVSRIASGHLDLAIGPVRLSGLIEDIIDMHQETIDKRALHVQMIDIYALPIVEGDGGQLKTALQNVISNAVKYTPDGGEIEISGRSVDGAGLITVRDSGLGIPAAERKRIFDQFHILGSIKNHSSSKSNFQGGGLGLGLPIAKGIFEAHGGRIWVDSRTAEEGPEPGSTFHILLPSRRDS